MVIEDRYKVVEKTMKRLGYERDSLIETLHSAQEVFGYLNIEILNFIAKKLRLPCSKVYGVASFYQYFKLKASGKHTCIVCTGTTCYIKGSEKLLKAIEDKFNIKSGETTEDNNLTLLTARCFGSCTLAPAIAFESFEGEILGNLNEEATINAIERILDEDNNS